MDAELGLSRPAKVGILSVAAMALIGGAAWAWSAQQGAEARARAATARANKAKADARAAAARETAARRDADQARARAAAAQAQAAAAGQAAVEAQGEAAQAAAERDAAIHAGNAALARERDAHARAMAGQAAAARTASAKATAARDAQLRAEASAQRAANDAAAARNEAAAAAAQHAEDARNAAAEATPYDSDDAPPPPPPPGAQYQQPTYTAPASRAQIMELQRVARVPADGIVGPQTLAAVSKAAGRSVSKSELTDASTVAELTQAIRAQAPAPAPRPVPSKKPPKAPVKPQPKPKSTVSTAPSPQAKAAIAAGAKKIVDYAMAAFKSRLGKVYPQRFAQDDGKEYQRLLLLDARGRQMSSLQFWALPLSMLQARIDNSVAQIKKSIDQKADLFALPPEQYATKYNLPKTAIPQIKAARGQLAGTAIADAAQMQPVVAIL